MVIALAVAAAAALLWVRPGSERAPGAGDGPAAVEDRAPLAAPPAPALPRPVHGAAPPARAEELHAALREIVEPVGSDVIVEAIEVDRISVCPGAPVRLAARVSGQAPGAAERWIWRAPGGAALHPGAAITWRAPAAPGRHRIHFQVCTDLGGRRIGVLAERSVDIEVRACDPGERQAGALRIAVTQRGHGVFSFAAVPVDGAGDDLRIDAYAWGFGDGTALTTTGPDAEHTYAVAELGAGDIARFPVTLEARRADGPPLQATAMALVRGQPAGDPSPVAMEVARRRVDPTGGPWESAITVRPESGERVTWDHIERVTRYFDDRVDVATLDWRDVVQVDESLEGGGFRGRVLVDAAGVDPGVKQIIDTLHGHTGDGEEVTLSWSPFERAPAPTADAGPPPAR